MLYYLTPKGVRIFDTPSREVSIRDQREFTVQPLAYCFKYSADLGNYGAEHYWTLVHFARCSKGCNFIESVDRFG
eukprot:scaffold70780_cov83-Cyclotella_meneghiniana.AAC.1